MFEKFDFLLSAELSEDYWFDVGCVDASDYLAGFLDEDWTRLAREIHNKSTRWIIRCLYSISETPNEFSYSLSRSFINSNDREIAVTALDSIRCIIPHVKVDSHDKEKIIAAVRKIEENSTQKNWFWMTSSRLLHNTDCCFKRL